MSQEWLQTPLPDLDTVTEQLFSSLMEDGQDCVTLEDFCEQLSTATEEELSKFERVPSETHVPTLELDANPFRSETDSRTVPKIDLSCQESIKDLYSPSVVKLQRKILDSAETTLKKRFFSYYTAFHTCELLKSDKHPCDGFERERFDCPLLVNSNDTTKTNRDDFLQYTASCLRSVVLGELKAELEGCEKKRKRK